MKTRLDDFLVTRGDAINKSKAQQYIKELKEVKVNGVVIKKPGFFVTTNCQVEIFSKEVEFVSRAGRKLAKAIDVWELTLDDRVCLDIGASTGGFTECCLNNGARLVFSVDVGSGQMVDSLKTNPKVINKEKYNFRNAIKQDFSLAPIDFFCCDVSFISVEKMLIPLKDLVVENAQGVILIKPQFESEIDEVKNGKVNSKVVHQKDINKVIGYANQNGFDTLKLDYSPIKGNKKNNIEYLLLLEKKSGQNLITPKQIEQIINEAWK